MGRLFASIASLLALSFGQYAPVAAASDFSEPWKRSDRALVIDAYEYNSIDWTAMVADKRITGFINKGSDGLPPPYRCSGNETEVRLCKALWKRYAVARELYHTRKTVAKALGLLWGAYHLARPGNPVEQADHFIEFAEPAEDDFIAIDIEDNDPDQWMSLDDAEIFIARIKERLGRYPALYTNGNTAKHIAANRDRYPLLSRLPLWYARYKPEIGEHFPKGNWTGYALWQFATQVNCRRGDCPYRPPGTPKDIDVNVAAMSAADLRAAWPFTDLVPHRWTAGGALDAFGGPGPAYGPPVIERMPLPIARENGVKGQSGVRFANVRHAPANERLALSFGIMAATRANDRPAPPAIAAIDMAALETAYRAAGERRAIAASDVPAAAEYTVASAANEPDTANKAKASAYALAYAHAGASRAESALNAMIDGRKTASIVPDGADLVRPHAFSPKPLANGRFAARDSQDEVFGHLRLIGGKKGGLGFLTLEGSTTSNALDDAISEYGSSPSFPR